MLIAILPFIILLYNLKRRKLETPASIEAISVANFASF